MTFTLCFEGSFWAGVLETAESGQVRATRHVFGGEPTDAELYAFLLRHGMALLERAQASPPVPAGTRSAGRPSPKRAMRLAAREAARVAQGRRSTASQEALRQELEQRKSLSRAESRERKRAEADRKHALARAKRKQRKRGR
ncbi:YjdF family protein [Streptomyces winkii]|uniref:YjdF family protein n=1 Tax=Streptomyces winkii TaxID=3051178 RepID=UPI0028D2B649|nr:YjdF family protein [Streptomyces sp. DSM 40971]